MYILADPRRLKIVSTLTNLFRSVILISPGELVECVYLCLNKVCSIPHDLYSCVSMCRVDVHVYSILNVCVCVCVCACLFAKVKFFWPKTMDYTQAKIITMVFGQILKNLTYVR